MTELQGLRVDNTTVGRGLSAWDSMSSELQSMWNKAVTRVRALNDETPWGDGSDGASFYAAYVANGGPEMLCAEGTRLVDEIVKVGPTMRKSVQNITSTDHGMAQDLNNSISV
ncbi:hypothetical protein OG417_46780 [Actinoallomurus sp. NBC_01490]|jgi:hypothetical protein|uniref:hypothetical protein n=1 Tax=Actinoallomurus sp. NBC_01490 TaxID=2903557 RepID=UPI002E2F5B6D|nr:hypothetical protein [Actinoallomurus sp. NBC_01490]